MKVNSESEMLSLGEFFAQHVTLPAVFELIGDVGMGKTTFTRGLARGLDITEPITSPSFTISKRYPFTDSQGQSGELVHYDFYRLDDPGIMRDELTETLSLPSSVVVIEWGGDVANLLPESKHQLKFTLNEDGSRTVDFNPTAQSVENLWKSHLTSVENSPESVEKTI